MDINEYREHIDSIDDRLLELLNERAVTSWKIGLLKDRTGLPVTDVLREEAVLHRVMQNKCSHLSSDAVFRIFKQILAESRQIQSKIRNAEATL